MKEEGKEKLNKEQEIVFPESLTEKDRQLVMRQCEIQQATSKEQIEGFARAYEYAKNTAHDRSWWNSITSGNLTALIRKLGIFVEERNKSGFRTVPATFRDGGHALDPSEIVSAMEKFAEAYGEGRFSPNEAYIEFEKIHPFTDGNGRVGDLLWKMLIVRETGTWPEKLPPDFFGKGAEMPQQTESSFGEVER